MTKRTPAYRALLIIGLAFIPLAIFQHIAFLGVCAVFFIAGVAGIMKERGSVKRS